MSANYVNSSALSEPVIKEQETSYSPSICVVPENGNYRPGDSPMNGKRGHNNPGCSRYDSYESDIPGVVRGSSTRRPRGGESISESEEYIQEMPSASRSRRMDGRSHMYEELPSTGFVLNHLIFF